MQEPGVRREVLGMGRNFGQVIAAMVTPFTAGGELDADRAGELARRLVAEGCDGLLVSGTTGESPTLSDREKLQLVTAVRQAVDDSIFLWAGSGSYDTRVSLRLSQEAVARGADGIMLVTPYYNKPPQEGLFRHFSSIADAVAAPVMVYNVPSRTGSNLLPATVLRLAEHERIVAVKEASGDLNQVSAIAAGAPDDFLIYSGDDALTLPVLAVGGWGVVSVAAHVAAPELVAMVQAHHRGDPAQARALHWLLFPLIQALFVTTNPIPVKLALREQGFDVGGWRLPLTGPTPDEAAAVRRALERLTEHRTAQ